MRRSSWLPVRLRFACAARGHASAHIRRIWRRCSLPHDHLVSIFAAHAGYAFVYARRNDDAVTTVERPVALSAAGPAIEAHGLRKSYSDVARAVRHRPARSRPGPCSACSARTAPARRPPSGSSPRCCRRPRRRRASPASTSSATPRSVRAQIGLAGQYAAVDENLTGLREPGDGRPPLPPGRREPRAGAPTSCSSASTSPMPPTGSPDLLGRHAPPARPRRGARRPPAGAVPRRADHRPRPAQPPRPLGDDRGRSSPAAPRCC